MGTGCSEGLRPSSSQRVICNTAEIYRYWSDRLQVQRRNGESVAPESSPVLGVSGLDRKIDQLEAQDNIEVLTPPLRSYMSSVVTHQAPAT